jgi:hypothetical protein
MKNYFKSFVLFGILAGLLFSSCGKYDEGPNFSLRSKKSRLVNVWVFDKVIQDGEDVTEMIKEINPNYSIDIRKDNTFIITQYDEDLGQMVEDKGKWEFSKDKEEVEFSDDETGQISTEEILRLTNNEFWAELDLGFTKLEFRYKPK